MKRKMTAAKNETEKTDMSRRKFLINSGTFLAGATAMSMIPPGIREALKIQAQNVTGTIKDVQHIVILMQEHRSFDHYFGTMDGVRGLGDRFPIPLESGKPVWYQSDGQKLVTPFHLDKNKMNAITAPCTSYEIDSAQAAWNQGKFGFWPKFKVDEITKENTGQSMGYCTQDEIPFQFALANAFTICDNYFSSVQGATSPNRVQFFSGSNFDPSLRAQGKNQTPATAEMTDLRSWVFENWPEPGYKYLGNALEWPTIPEVLENAGISWRIYQNPNNNCNGSANGCLAFKNFREAAKDSPLYQKGLSNFSLEDLQNDVKQGKLPQVSWILPSQGEAELGMGSSTAQGADFTNRVLSALTANPDVWSKTVLFITFDQNDGYFDHIPPPAIPSYNLDGTIAGSSTLDVNGMYFDATGVNEYEDAVFLKYCKKMGVEPPSGRNHSHYIDPEDKISGLVRPIGMGPRVPMYVVSPWSKGGWVSSQVFDHTSVGQFLEKRFDIVIPAISPWSRAVSGDLTSAFDFTLPDNAALPVLPATANYKDIETQQKQLPKPMAPAQPAVFKQKPGSRPSRPTPYILQVISYTSTGNFGLQFINRGKQGAVFHVYDKLHLDRIPRRYTVEGGKTLEEAIWGTAADNYDYDLEIYSANGFFRSVKGNMRDTIALNAHLEYDEKDGSVYTTINNYGQGVVAVRIAHNAYEYAKYGTLNFSVRPGRTDRRIWNLSQSGNWYDITIAAANYRRRYAGRMENGKNLISDPAMGL